MNRAGGGLDEAAGLVERRLADALEVEQGGELLGELINQVDFAVEVQHLAGQGPAFGLLGGQLGEQSG